MTREERQLREAIIAKCRWMNASGLNQGTSGNISARYKDRMLISPSATPYDAMKPEMIASMPLDGEYGAWEGPLQPSTEWRFHLDIMRARPDVGGIVHTHSTYATVLAIARKSIPACHYMMAAFGGNDIRCADYARYGTRNYPNSPCSARRPQRLPARQSRHDRGRCQPGQGDVACRRARDDRTPVLSLARTRRTAHSQRGGDRGDGEWIFDLRTAAPKPRSNAKRIQSRPRRELRRRRHGTR